jgi:hypothetical protein
MLVPVVREAKSTLGKGREPPEDASEERRNRDNGKTKAGGTA